MRHRLDVIDEIADFLQTDAQRRERGPGPGQIYDFEGGGLYVAITSRTAYTTIRIGRWSWSGKRVEDDLYVTVYFGSAPPDDAANRPDVKRVNRELRKAFRAKTFPTDIEPFLWTDKAMGGRIVQTRLAPGEESRLHRYKVLVIDSKTKKDVIVEMLAMFLIQAEIADESVWKAVAPDVAAEDRAGFIAELTKFVDPNNPASYREYRRILKCALARQRRAMSIEILGDTNFLEEAQTQFAEDKKTQEQRLQKRRQQRRKPADLDRRGDIDLPVYRVVMETGLSKTKIYDLVKSGEIEAKKDTQGRPRIPRSECERLRQMAIQEILWKRCVDLRERFSNHRAAQRWVERKRAAGIQPSELLTSLRKEC